MPELWGGGGWGLGLWGASDAETGFDEITTYYINLLIMQYITRPNARKVVGTFVNEITVGSLIENVRDAFDIETAVGAQLEMLAAYRGLVRTVYGIDLTRAYFELAEYADTAPLGGVGFAFYSDSPTDYSLTYPDIERPIYAMTDNELRRITQLVSKTQSRFLSLEEVDDILFEFFGDNLTLTDNQNMTILYTHNPADTDNLYKIAHGLGVLPRPAGVSVSYA